MYKKVLIALFTVAAMAGCASKGAHEASTPVDNGAGSATSSAPTQPVQIGDANDAANGVGLFDSSAKANIIYFAFDSSAIDAAGQATVGKFAKYLSANPTVKVRIEGNTDERGTREYNIGLGERRADAVKSALTAQGVSAGQLSVVSYGEERPAAQGHDEAAWSQNRRAVIIRQ